MLPAVACALVTAAFWPCLAGARIEAGDDPAAAEPGRPAAAAGAVPALLDGGWQPLAELSLRLDRALWRDAPRGYHATSLILHVLNTALVFLLARMILGHPRVARGAGGGAWGVRVGALAAALLFGLHPLRVEPVAWIAARGALLAGLLAGAGVAAYWRAAQRRAAWPWLPATLGAYALALLAGPYALGLPLALVALDIFPLGRPLGRPRACLEKLPLLAVAVAAAAAHWWLSAPGEAPALSVVERLARAAYGLALPAWKTIWPAGLVPAYELRPPLALLSLKYLGSAAAVLTAAALAIGYARRAPALAAAGAGYAALVLPWLGWLPTGALEAADRWTYLPAAAIALLAGGGLAWLGTSGRAVRRWLAGGLALLALALGAGLGVLTWRQAQVWRSADALWRHAYEHGPPSGLACYRLGRELARRGDSERAIQLYRAAVNLRPGLRAAHASLGSGLLASGRVAEAIDVYRRALRLHPDVAPLHRDLAAALAAADEFAAAEQHLLRALKLDPRDARAHAALGHLRLLTGRFEEAADALRAALALDPGSAALACDLGRAYRGAGQRAAAEEAFRQALALDPGYEPAREALADLAREPE